MSGYSPLFFEASASPYNGLLYAALPQAGGFNKAVGSPVRSGTPANYGISSHFVGLSGGKGNIPQFAPLAWIKGVNKNEDKARVTGPWTYGADKQGTNRCIAQPKALKPGTVEDTTERLPTPPPVYHRSVCNTPPPPTYPEALGYLQDTNTRSTNEGPFLFTPFNEAPIPVGKARWNQGQQTDDHPMLGCRIDRRRANPREQIAHPTNCRLHAILGKSTGKIDCLSCATAFAESGDKGKGADLVNLDLDDFDLV
ncbi:hypothetical protein NMY22_g3392 [Coprinellus aureogranulatus]|nr:hypothetical protein NMY22_g3392 [Coprinellus aureogranulatus]